MLHNLILWLLHHLMFSGTVSFFGLGQGPSGAEKREAGALASIGSFGTGEGEGDILASDNFWKSILSGDPSAISKVLGPEISGINQRGQQEIKTASEFGNRGGGTNASMQMAGDTTRTSVDQLIASLTGKAAGALGASGQNLLSTGLSGHEAAFSAEQTIQQQKAAKWNDIFKSIADVAGGLFTGGGSIAATGIGGSGPGLEGGEGDIGAF